MLPHTDLPELLLEVSRAGSGVTYYNFTSDQFTKFHRIVIPGTLKDSLYLLSGILEPANCLAAKRSYDGYCWV
ncbi:Tn3 family transposase [Brevibacillus fortis]|uniref:Tn3 family transposase n=1 Tax=Brevibacillus fortis TaxID=2126352 RepID=UPI003CC62136